MNPKNTLLTMAALVVGLAYGEIAAAADDNTTKSEPRAAVRKHRDPGAIFKRLDGDGDGKIAKEEFEKMRERMRERMREHRARAKGGTAGEKGQIGDRFFTHLDANKDGAISLDEFKKLGEMRGRAGGGNPDPEKLKQLRERRRAGSGADAAKKSATADKPGDPAK